MFPAKTKSFRLKRKTATEKFILPSLQLNAVLLQPFLNKKIARSNAGLRYWGCLNIYYYALL